MTSLSISAQDPLMVLLFCFMLFNVRILGKICFLTLDLEENYNLDKWILYMVNMVQW